MTKDPYKNWRLEHDEDEIAWLHIDKHDANANALSADVLGELDAILQVLADAHPRGLVILSAKQGGFIAGADVNGVHTA